MNDSPAPGHSRVADGPGKDSGEASGAPADPDPSEVPALSGPNPAGFRFNLDDALARLSEPHLPIPRFKWSAVTPSTTDLATTDQGPPPPQGPMHSAAPPGQQSLASPPASMPPGTMFPDQGSRVRPLTQPTLDPLPEILEATPVGMPSTAHWSTVPAPAPAPAAPAPAAPAPAALVAATETSPELVTGTSAFAAGATGFMPDDSNGAWSYGPVGDGPPTLPASNPAAAPPMATAPTPAIAPKISNAAAARARKKKKSRRRTKVIVFLLVLGGLGGAAFKFGRSYLFPEEGWPKEVVPTVDALQLSSGLEFADPVTIVTLPEAEYEAKVGDTVFGPAFGATWTTSVPRWRALGLVDGEPTVDSVNAVASTWLPAHYDPVDGQIYRSATATGPALEAAMEDALVAALLAQQIAPAVAPAADAVAPAPSVTATAQLAKLAVADLAAELVAGPPTTEPDRTPLGPLPVPMAHRLIGAEDLGAPILDSLGVAPDRAGAIAGFAVDVTTVLDVPLTAAPVPTLVEGDLADGDAAALGSDFWYTVLAAYLPADTAADTADAIGADLYSPVLRGAQQCVYGTFTPTTPELLGVLQVSLLAWAELAPTHATAQSTTLADGVTVQMSTCDPGPTADAVRTADVATALVTRQLARLNPA